MDSIEVFRKGLQPHPLTRKFRMKSPPPKIHRRSFIGQTSAVLASATLLPELRSFAVESAEAQQATGLRIGEVTDTSAIVWARLTANATRRAVGSDASASEAAPDQLEGACPGAPGRMRLRYGIREDLRDATTTDWAEVSTSEDFTHHFALSGLKPATTYFFASESVGADGKAHGALRGQFRTAPTATSPTELTFCVMTCQGYPDRGHPDGHAIYPAMLALQPGFACLTGDLVYYDNDAPKATSPALARYHWQRMFSLPRLFEFNRQVATYWLKDDHDTLNNDSWPGREMGTFTFAEGQKIFRQQAPMVAGPSYRTFRWGRDLQIWLTDGRDFRSPNDAPDGPSKTIWGAEQKAWFFRTVKESRATWKILISPTPLVGPDRGKKNDNHSNAGFQHEGDEIRTWLKANVPENFFVICGDRHWQYHSVHPQTGLHEFSVGAASDEHAGGSPGEDPKYHRFHRVKGGFLAVRITPAGEQSSVRFEHRDVNGREVYHWSTERKFSQ